MIINNSNETSQVAEKIYSLLFKKTITPEILEHSIKAINLLKKNHMPNETTLFFSMMNIANDLIALELYLRYKKPDNLITKTFLIVFAISECYAIHYSDVVNEKKSRFNAIGLFLVAAFKTPFIYIKGYILYRKQCKKLP